MIAQRQRNAKKTSYPTNVHMIDAEFDRYEAINDLAAILHHAEMATYYHIAIPTTE